MAPWRMLVGFWVGLSILFALFFCIGADRSKELPQWRKKCIKLSLFFCCYVATRLHLFMTVNEIQVDADYSEYLGPNWKTELKKYNKVIPTIVTNHSSFLDIWLLLASKYMPAFLARAETKTSFVGKQADGLQCLYITREGPKDEKSKVLNELV
jgi:1-acyl-sn-glycerol-3-phosphate acyltransferase